MAPPRKFFDGLSKQQRYLQRRRLNLRAGRRASVNPYGNTPPLHLTDIALTQSEYHKVVSLCQSIVRMAGEHVLLTCGGLLGIARNGSLLPWDDDLDFIILPEFEQEFLNLDWSLVGLGVGRGPARMLKVWRLDGVPVPVQYNGRHMGRDQQWRWPVADIFIVEPMGGCSGSYHYAGALHRRLFPHEDRIFFEPVTHLNAHGVTVRVPAGYSDWLSQAYPGWKHTARLPSFDHRQGRKIWTKCANVLYDVVPPFGIVALHEPGMTREPPGNTTDKINNLKSTSAKKQKAHKHNN